MELHLLPVMQAVILLPHKDRYCTIRDKQFSPRIRDLADQELYRTSQIQLDGYPKLKSHLQSVINKERILIHWDEMLRLAGSLKTGRVTASLIVQKLQAYPRQHPLTRALQELTDAD